MTTPPSRLCLLALTAALVAAAGCTQLGGTPDVANLEREVTRAERAFARTMANRDHEAFTEFLAEDAVFFSGREELRGKAAVAAGWKASFEDAAAPFSWEPDQVSVLDSGRLALSTGPVHDPDGNVTGRFQSVWRRESDGRWRVVFDKGTPVCLPAARESFE